MSMLKHMSVKLEGKLSSLLGFKTKGLERFQTVRPVNSSTYSQKDSVEANFACGLRQVIKHAVLPIGGFGLAPKFGLFAILDFHKMDVLLAGNELTGVLDLGQGKVSLLALRLRAPHPFCTLPFFLMRT